MLALRVGGVPAPTMGAGFVTELRDGRRSPPEPLRICSAEPGSSREGRASWKCGGDRRCEDVEYVLGVPCSGGRGARS